MQRKYCQHSVFMTLNCDHINRYASRLAWDYACSCRVSTLRHCGPTFCFFCHLQVPAASDVIKRTVKIEASTVEIEERGVKLRLTVVGKT